MVWLMWQAVHHCHYFTAATLIHSILILYSPENTYKTHHSSCYCRPVQFVTRKAKSHHSSILAQQRLESPVWLPVWKCKNREKSST